MYSSLRDGRNKHTSLSQVSIPQEEDLHKQRRTNRSNFDQRCSPPPAEEIASQLIQNTAATYSVPKSVNEGKIKKNIVQIVRVPWTGATSFQISPDEMDKLPRYSIHASAIIIVLWNTSRRHT